jgi:hypothetical protein
LVNQASSDPLSPACAEVKIKNLADIEETFFQSLTRDHQMEPAQAVELFRRYVGVVCPKCLGGYNGEQLLKFTLPHTAAKLAKLGASVPMYPAEWQVRLNKGLCPNCDSTSFYALWRGTKSLGGSSKSTSAKIAPDLSSPERNIRLPHPSKIYVAGYAGHGYDPFEHDQDHSIDEALGSFFRAHSTVQFDVETPIEYGGLKIPCDNVKDFKDKLRTSMAAELRRPHTFSLSSYDVFKAVPKVLYVVVIWIGNDAAIAERLCEGFPKHKEITTLR